MPKVKVYLDDATPDMPITFIPNEGWYTWKSKQMMWTELASDFGENFEIIPLTPELQQQMLAAGDFDGYEPG